MSCIFCQIIEEADPVKVPEIGDDYAVIKGKKIGQKPISGKVWPKFVKNRLKIGQKSTKTDWKIVKIAKNWSKSTKNRLKSVKIWSKLVTSWLKSIKNKSKSTNSSHKSVKNAKKQRKSAKKSVEIRSVFFTREKFWFFFSETVIDSLDLIFA